MTQFGLQRMKENEKEKEGNFCEAYLTFIHGRTEGRTDTRGSRSVEAWEIRILLADRLRLESLPRRARQRFRHFLRNRAICGRPSAWLCEKETSAADSPTGDLISFWEDL